MARTRRIKKETDACYHVTSRIAGKRYLLGSPKLKREMIGILERVASFSGVSVFAYCVMDNHFHVVCKVVKSSPDEGEVIRRIGLLKGDNVAKLVSSHLQEFRRLGRDADAEAELNRWRRRMEDLSEFVKTFKETFGRAYRRDRPYNGSIWEGRFKSTLVETGDYLRRVVKYVNFNPVRAHMVSDCSEYQWCTAGDRGAFATRCRTALAAELGIRQWGQSPNVEACPNWGQTPKAAFAAVNVAGASNRGQTPNVEVSQQWGQTPKEVLASVNAAGASNRGLSPNEAAKEVWLMKRMPQFVSGKLFGSLGFVEAAIGAFKWCERRLPRPHAVPGGGFASHGQRLAREVA